MVEQCITERVTLYKYIWKWINELKKTSTCGKIQFIFYWNWMMTVFSLHISATLHLTIFGIWITYSRVQYVTYVMIVRELWYIGLAILYAIWIVAHLCISHGTFLRINHRTTLSPLDGLPRIAGGAPAVIHKATAIWLALRILAGNEHCNMCDGNPVSEYIFNFLWSLMNECIQNMVVVFASICSASMPNFTSI